MTLSPITELTLSNIFQAVLTDAYDRLQKDHAENDIHLNIMTERQAKREADLRQNLQVRFQRFVQLINYIYTIFSSMYTSTQFSSDPPHPQEAWSQLEILGQDPTALRESCAAQQQLEEMKKQLQTM